MMIDPSDPYYTATGCAEEGFPVRPVPIFPSHRSAVQASSDPILTHERWSGEFRGCAVELPTGTTSGTLAIRIAKRSSVLPDGGFSSLLTLQSRCGALPVTPYYEDANHYWTLIYECPDEVVIRGVVKIADGITLYGNGASIILPPYECPEREKLVTFPNAHHLTREKMVMAPHWIVSKAVGVQFLRVTQQWNEENNLLQHLEA